MRKRIIILLFLMAIMAILPFISMKNTVKEDAKDTQKNVFHVLDTSCNQITAINDRDFCIGALAYEMPSDFSKEALKAQCIACYTHFSKLREDSKENYDFKANLSKNEFYLKDIPAESKKIYSQAVDEVFGKVLTDSKGNLIKIAYHAISSGQTESAKDIFGFESEFLQPVSSAGDVNVSGYLSSKEFSGNTFQKIMSEKGVSFSGEPSQWIGEIKRTNSGTVMKIQIGNQTFSGAEIREIFSLRSADFDIMYINNKFILTVYGYGHGVGMSQYGADSMAKQGATYEEIIHHYYGNCLIQKSSQPKS